MHPSGVHSEELAAYYSNYYRLDYQAAWRSDPPRYHQRRSAREAKTRATLIAPALRSGAKVLDFGSGSGEFLAAAHQAGCSTIGVEPGRSYAAFAMRRHGVNVVDSREARFRDAYFDVITANHVLEHMRDPVEALMRLSQWLAPHGVLFVSVPNMATPHRLTHERFHFAHVHGFVPETLDLAASRCGLEPDPRYTREGTMVVYRKSSLPLPTEIAAPEVVVRILQLYPRRSVLADVASGAWLLPALRRWLKAIRETFRREEL